MKTRKDTQQTKSKNKKRKDTRTDTKPNHEIIYNKQQKRKDTKKRKGTT